jgi:OmpA-OmpF porin, OOP family
MVSSRDGANTLWGLIRNGGYGAAAEDVFSLFGGGGATTNVLSAGQQLVGKIFGSKTSAVSDVVAQSSGVSPASASKLMALAAPLTLGVLGKTSGAGADSASLTNTLLHAKDEIAAAAPAGLSRVLSTGTTDLRSRTVNESVSEPVSIERFPESETAIAAPPKERSMGWLPLLLLALAAAGLLLYLLGRSPRREATAVSPGTAEAVRVDLPGGRNISVPRGSMNYELAAFLANPSAGPLPKTFTFDNLNFESATTQLTPESNATVNTLATILQAYPNARVALAGHTDNTGTPDANQTLSLDRANAVKSMLVAQGVSADAISTNGYGQTHPVATNETPEGRERNRRLELVVNSK